MEKLPRLSIYSRLAITLLYALAVASSLVVFPNALPMLAAAWLTIASVQLARHRTGWLPLVLCGGVLVAKWPDWSPWLLGFVGSIAICVFVMLFLQRESIRPTVNRFSFIALTAVWATWIGWAWESNVGAHHSEVLAYDPSRPIVCVGDSLTTGLGSHEAYPEYLQELVSAPIVNWGRAGVTASDMVNRLPEVLANHPQLVVVELGGHDFLRGYGREVTKQSLVTIIEASCDAGAAVVLVEIPRGFIIDPFAGLERELAREYDLELIPDSAIRILVVRSPAIPVIGEVAKPHLSDDGLHPNLIGAKHLAKQVHAAIVRLYGSTIDSDND